MTKGAAKVRLRRMLDRISAGICERKTALHRADYDKVASRAALRLSIILLDIKGRLGQHQFVI